MLESESFRDEKFSDDDSCVLHKGSLSNNPIEISKFGDQNQQVASPQGKGGKGLFSGLLNGLKQEDNMEDADGPVKENWQFWVFQLKKRKYHVFKNGISDKLNIPTGPDDETLIMWINFREKELKTILIDKLKVNPIMFYEWMLLSPVDKMFEFDENSIFYNMVINKDNFQESPMILRIIRKDNFAVIIVTQGEKDAFQLTDEIASKFSFKEIKKLKFPKLFHKRGQKVETTKQIDNHPLSLSRLVEMAIENPAALKRKGSIDTDEGNPEIAKGEVGRVIIQKMKTIKPLNDAQVNIDYILFWLSSEGLKKIENTINWFLLTEVNAIQQQSRDTEEIDKLQFLQRMDSFENHYIGAQNAKESKQQYFDKIIESQLVAIDFRYLIRHLKSRMTNLSMTTFVIERKLTLSRDTFQLGIDTKMTEYSEQLDSLMRKFTLVSVMFLPLTVLTGMWGMNWKVPYNDVDNFDWFYWICGVMVGILVGFYVFFKIKGWM